MAVCLWSRVNVDCASGGDCYFAGIIDHLLMTVLFPMLSSVKIASLTYRTQAGVAGTNLCLMEIHLPSYDDVANDVVNCVDDESSQWLFVQALKLLSMNLFYL